LAGFLIFVLVFVSCDFEVGSNDSCDPRKNFSFDLNEIWYVEVDEWCMTVCSMTLSKVKVTSSWKLEILPFSTAVFAICNGSWQLTA